MIRVELALRLRAAGLAWEPAAGDRFVIAHRGMDEEVFVLSDMTIDVHRYPTGTHLGFNGTTEWALDSVEQDEAVWLPSETQLRERLGTAFLRLVADPGAAADECFGVTVRTPSGERTWRADDAGQAYGLALLAVLGADVASGSVRR
jgi:hypothetical protein